MTPLPKQPLLSMHLNKDELKHIENLQNTFDIIAILKELYNGSENADVQLLMVKLYSLKTKSIYSCKDVISEIKKKIFSSLEKHNIYLGKLEKLMILYLSFPVNLKILLQPRGNEDVDNFIKDGAY